MIYADLGEDSPLEARKKSIIIQEDDLDND